MADELLAHTDAILEANKQDVEAAKGKISDVMIDRLMLDAGRIEGMAKGIRELICLEDPAGKVIRTVERPNGIIIEKTACFGILDDSQRFIKVCFGIDINMTDSCSSLDTWNFCILHTGADQTRTSSWN